MVLFFPQPIDQVLWKTRSMLNYQVLFLTHFSGQIMFQPLVRSWVCLACQDLFQEIGSIRKKKTTRMPNHPNHWLNPQFFFGCCPHGCWCWFILWPLSLVNVGQYHHVCGLNVPALWQSFDWSTLLEAFGSRQPSMWDRYMWKFRWCSAWFGGADLDGFWVVRCHFDLGNLSKHVSTMWAALGGDMYRNKIQRNGSVWAGWLITSGQL